MMHDRTPPRDYAPEAYDDDAPRRPPVERFTFGDMVWCGGLVALLFLGGGMIEGEFSPGKILLAMIVAAVLGLVGAGLAAALAILRRGG